MKKKFKQLMATLLSLLIILSAFPTTVFAATYITDMNSDAEFGVVSGSLDKYGHEMHYAKYDGKTYIVFCVEFGKTSPTGITYEYGKDFVKYVNRSGDTYRKIADYIAFGYTLQYGDGLPNTKAEWIAACCTQQFVWETLGVNPIRSSWNSTYMSDSLYKSWLADTEDLIESYYDKQVSFNNSTKTINLGGTATLTDSNGVLKDYPTFSKTINKVTISHTNGENKLTVSVADDCTTHSVSFNSASNKIYRNMPNGASYNDDTMNYVYFDFESGSIQNLMFSQQADPQTFKFDIDVQFGNIKITKTSEDNIVKGMEFTVKRNGKTYTMTTDANGTATLNNIPVGTYTISEKEIIRYEVQTAKSVTVSDGKTTNVSFNNELKTGNIKIQKHSEDNIVSDFTFKVTGSDGKTYDATTNSSGIATVSNLPVYDSNNNKITYTVQETNIPVRYVDTDNQTVILNADQTSTLTFNNILKKFRVKVVKSDIEEGTAQGDASLAGATYGLFKGDELIDTYVTDSNASFTTDYYVCDTDWILKELDASEGYLVNSTVYKVGADPKLYTIEYNTTNNEVKEQVIKGNIAIIKHTDDGSTQIETAEKGAEFQIYLKSAGSFVNADEDERDTIVCDEDGFASSKLMPYGVYTVHQTKGWDGREKIKDFDVFINSDGKTYKFLINNSNFESYVKVVKLDAETGKQIAYSGAGFEIYDSEGHRVTMQFTYPEVTSIHTFYTNSEGYLITPETLPYGDYTLVEVQAPYGYVLDSTPIPFSITQENSSTDTGVTVVKVKAKDIPQKGTIEIGKTGEVFYSVGVLGGGYVDENGNEVTFPITYQPIYEVKGLPNTVFQIYAAEDITTLDGTVRAYQGELVDEITTDKDGKAKSKELYLGKYTVIEKTATEGFYNPNEQYDVELTYAGQNVSVASTELSLYNERQKVTISLAKELEQDDTFGIGMNGEIQSVQFGIYANEDIKALDGSVITKDALITYASCDENGKITFNCDLPIGFKWYVKEIATDEQYITSNTKYAFETQYKGQTVNIYDIAINDGEPIANELIYGTVKGIKTDRETGNTIEGAAFGLFLFDETEFTEENAVLTAESDKDGIFTFDNVPYGEWIVKELYPAENYLPSDDIHHITVSEDEQIIEINAVNDMIPELKTTATIGGEKEVDVQDKITIDDIVEYKHLVPGKEYILKGVLMNKATNKPFTVDGKEITSEVSFVPEKPNGEVKVSFTFDASGITENTEIVVFETLYLDGTELAAHADIEDEGQTVTITVPVPETPDTGDNRNYGVWIGLAAIALGAAVSALVLKIKAKKEEGEE